MKNSTVALIIGGLFILFLFLFGVYKLTNTGSSTQSYPNVTVIKADDHVKWTKDSKNVLVEYSDFQCPACRTFYEVMKPIEASGSSDFKITQKITFAYRHFPLYQIHQNAMAAAYAAEAAGKQGKFFEMGNLLFDTQSEWSKLGDPKDYFTKLAESLKLDTAKFKADMDSTGVKQKVENDLASGNAIGIDATPTYFLNGKKLDLQSPDQFKNLLSSL